MEYGILGPLVVRRDGREVPIGSAKQRALLVLFLLRRGELVSTESLVDQLWGERPPATALKALRVHVSQLRKALDPGVLETRPAGYMLRVEPGALDAERFEALLTHARALLADGNAREAASDLRKALESWRGAPLVEFRHEDFARDEIARLDELRVVALECRLEADLAIGRHAETVPELEALVREYPLRENLRRLQMLALYRAGRQADALAAYQDARRALRDELGLDPGEGLRRIETAILRHDPSLSVPGQAEVPSAPTLTAIDAREPAGRSRADARAGRRRALVALACAVAGGTIAVVGVVVETRGGPGEPDSAASVSADSVAVFDPDDGHVSGQVPVGASVSAVTSGAGSIWVADVDGHGVARIDPAKKVVIQRFEVGNGPDGIAFGGGEIWVANGLDGTVTQIDPETDTVVQTIRVGNEPMGVAVARGYVWVANSSDGSVSRISLATGKVLARTISVGASADGLAVGDGDVWVTGQSTGTVTGIDARTGSVLAPIHAGSGADAVAVGAGSVWVANSLDGTVTRIDPATDDVVSVIPVGDGPDHIAAAGGAVWVSNELSGTLSRIDPTRNAVVDVVKTRNRPEGVVIDAGALFVAMRASGAGHLGGTLTVSASSTDLVPTDPAVAYGVLGSEVATLTNDGLTSFRKVGGSAGTELVPDLAVSLPVPTNGGRSYSFRLRPGIRYSTGALLRPQDVRRGIERSIELNAADGAVEYYSRIVGAVRCLAAPTKPCDLSKGIVADPSSDTVTFHLTSPDPDFLFELALPAADAVPAGMPLHPHGFVPATGPYEIASFDRGHAIRLVRNPRFREWSPAAQPTGFPNTIVIRAHSSSDAAVAAALHGRIDLATQLTVAPPVLTALLTRHPAQLEVDPWDITYSLVLNTRVAPFDDLRVRRAVNFAVDRKHLRDLTLGPGLGEVTCQILPPDFSGYQRYCPYTAEPGPGGDWSAPDLTRARQLVRASRTAGESVTVWMPPWLPFGTSAARYVVSVLDSLGYKAGFRIMRSQADDPYPREDKLHLQIGFFGWFPDFASPSGDIPPGFTCSSYNPVNALNQNSAEFCDPAVDREIAHAQSLQTLEPEEASLFWQKIDRDITDKAPWVAFANGVTLAVKSQRVGNYQYSPQSGTLLDQLWVR